jgi:hypothetical protein
MVYQHLSGNMPEEKKKFPQFIADQGWISDSDSVQ